MLDDEQILSTALEEFAARGFDAVSLRELNRRLGASPGMLTQRFGTKEALWTAAVDLGFGRHQERLLEAAAVADQADDDIERLRLLVAAFVRTAADHPHLQRVINVEACQDSPRVEHLFTRFIQPMLVEFLRPLVDGLTAAKRVRAISDRELFFLVANGAASVYALAPLSAYFDAHDGPLDVDSYASSVADLMVAALSID